jgi:hypothetical protein
VCASYHRVSWCVATGIAVPFGMGAAMSPLLYHKLLVVDEGYREAPLTSFVVFVSGTWEVPPEMFTRTATCTRMMC